MRTIETEQASRDWRRLAADASREPVVVTGGAEGAMVVMSEAEFQRLKGKAWDRLTAAMDRMAAEAAASGLTEEKLEELLADES